MPALPDHVTPTIAAIHARREAEAFSAREAESPFIRASGAYHECARSIWYDFRWVSAGEGFSARMLRLLETGHMHEARVLADLEKIEDVTIHRIDPDTGEQIEINIAGYIRGHTDGVMLGVPEAPKTWHLIECKTANDKNFGAIKSKGVERAKPDHWLQVQLYMRGAGLKRCLYFLVNKNTDEEYVERIRADAEATDRAIARLVTIAEAPRPPGKIRDKGDKPPCIYIRSSGEIAGKCRHYSICHEGAEARVTCRSCLHASPRPGGIWQCERHGHELTPEAQAEGCPDHRYIPDLVAGEQVDVQGDAVVYRLASGETWVDGAKEAAA